MKKATRHLFRSNRPFWTEHETFHGWFPAWDLYNWPLHFDDQIKTSIAITTLAVTLTWLDTGNRLVRRNTYQGRVPFLLICKGLVVEQVPIIT